MSPALILTGSPPSGVTVTSPYNSQVDAGVDMITLALTSGLQQ